MIYRLMFRVIAYILKYPEMIGKTSLSDRPVFESWHFYFIAELHNLTEPWFP